MKIINGIKNSWIQNRVLFVLTTILIICIVLIGFIGIDYFLGTKKDKYGDRLENIEKYSISSQEKKEIEKSLNENEKIENVTVRTVGKIIYVTIKYNNEISLNEAQAIAVASVDLFKEKQLKNYDINYTLKQDKTETNEGFLIMGARNVNGNGVIWNNNTPITEEDGE